MRAVNLIPAEQRGGGSVGAGQSEGAAYAVLALLGGVALLIALYGVASRHISSRQAETARVTAQAQRAQAAAQGLAPFTSFVATRTQRMEAVTTLVNSRFDWAHAFHEFGRVLPSGVSIGALEGTVGASGPGGSATPAAPAASSTTTPSSSSSSASGSSAAPAASSSSAAAAGTQVTSATPTGSVPTFTLNGCATSQREVAVMLERLRLIDGISEVSLQSSTKSTSSGGSGASGTCPSKAAAFSVHLAFAPLPAAPVKTGSTATVAQTTKPSSGGASSTTEVSAR
jgi:Tfp pilus assembly protein PilN